MLSKIFLPFPTIVSKSKSLSLILTKKKSHLFSQICSFKKKKKKTKKNLSKKNRNC